MGRVHRTTTFVRQAANPWKAKRLLRHHLLLREKIDFDPAVSIVVDSFPVPACRFARAYRSAGVLVGK